MIKSSKRLKTAVVLFVIIMLVVYALAILLPHECPEADCAICHTFDSYKGISVGALLLTAYFIPMMTAVISTARERVVPFSDGTPVGLKVKLSH